MSHHKPYPFYRYVCWIFGVISVSLSLVGPLASRAHTDFAAHMMVHLLLGMLAPLLLTLAAPITLLLRTLSVNRARRIARILKSAPLQLVTDPLAAALLNVGGLWILYATNLFSLVHHSLILHFLVQIHVFFAGYLFTVSMIYIDPTPHRKSFVYRTVILLMALTGHGILSKYIYAHPPTGVPVAQAEIGGMLMYYGGDFIDICLISILFLQWFKAARPQELTKSL